MNKYPLPDIVTQSDNDVLQSLNTITFKQLEEMTKAFARHSGKRLKAGQWLHDDRPTNRFFSGDVGDFKIMGQGKDSSLFTPFVEKHVFPSGSKIVVLGDIHGDIGSFASVMDHLHHHGYLDDDYHIVEDNFYIVFAGDYVNRLPYSVEVMKLLFHMHEHNIGKVFVLRGNHEFAECNKHFYDMLQLAGHEKESDVYGQESLLEELAYKFDLYFYPDLLYWFDYLPLSCYLGCKDEETGMTNMIQFSHAGFEVGYNAQEFLKSPDDRYQKINTLDRHSAMQKALATDSLSGLNDRVKEVFAYLEGTPMESLAHSYTKPGTIDLSDPQSPYRLKLGTQWNCFLSEDNDIGFSASLKGENLHFGQKMTEYFLSASNTEKTKIVSMVRSHQHRNDSDPKLGLDNKMLDHLHDRHGCVREWDGLVYTLGDSGMRSDAQAFMMITLASDPSKWVVEHFFKRPEEEQFSVEMFRMLGSL